MSDKVKVYCRIRPCNRNEETRAVWRKKLNKNSVQIKDGEGDCRDFTFNGVFGPKSTQDDIFKECGEPIVKDVLRGYNGTIFAYGQTGSGKTYTMTGTPAKEGITRRCIDYMFDSIKKCADKNIDISVTVSYIEIYEENIEKIRDLLNNKKHLELIGGTGKIEIKGCKKYEIRSKEEAVIFLYNGASNRAKGSTNLNEESSRSHSVFIITVTKQNETKSTEGKLYLVDLAGSENVKASKGKRLKEAKFINKSLSQLGLVIHRLTDGSTHIPYRDSKLTRLLQNSLGGNAKTALVLCCSPSEDHYYQTLSTLGFGERAKKIKIDAHVNEIQMEHKTSGEEDLKALLNASRAAETYLQNEIKELQQKVNESQKKDEINNDASQKKDEEIRKLKRINNEKDEKIRRLEKELEASKSDKYTSKITDAKETGTNTSSTENEPYASAMEVGEMKDNIKALEGQLQEIQKYQVDHKGYVKKFKAEFKEIQERQKEIEDIEEELEAMNAIRENKEKQEPEEVKRQEPIQEGKEDHEGYVKKFKAEFKEIQERQQEIEDIEEELEAMNAIRENKEKQEPEEGKRQEPIQEGKEAPSNETIDDLIAYYQKFYPNGTPFIIACEKGNLEDVKSFLANNPDVVNELGKTIWGCECTGLMVAAMYGNNPEVAKLLLDNGAKVNPVDKKGMTPLYWAAVKGHTEVVTHLLGAKANVNQADRFGQRPLHMVAYNGHTDIVELLLDAGVDINPKDEKGRTPLLFAAEYGRTEVVKLLLENGAEVNTVISSGWYKGDTPLHAAAEGGHTKTIELLLKKGAEVNQAGDEGDTPLHKAALSGRTDTVALLLKKGADPNIAAIYGVTPLDRADNEEIRELLKAHRDKKGSELKK